MQLLNACQAIADPNRKRMFMVLSKDCNDKSFGGKL
jgi:hypothetical protein